MSNKVTYFEIWDTMDSRVTIMEINDRGFAKPLVIDNRIVTFPDIETATDWMLN